MMRVHTNEVPTTAQKKQEPADADEPTREPASNANDYDDGMWMDC